VSRPSLQLRDAALGYASRGIPVLPLHYPLPHRRGLQPVSGDKQPAVRSRCSCRDPSCGQPAKHPLGSLVPHGVKDATCNRARILAWWTRHPQANIGLATGQRFDVLDVDGPTGAQAIRQLAAAHGLHSSGPLVRTGGGGWHFYLAPTGLGNVQPGELEHVDWRGRGGYVVAPPSRHPSGHPYRWAPDRDLDTPLAEVPTPLRARLERRSPQRSPHPVELPAGGAAPADRYARAALAQELTRVATAPVGQRNRQLWESTRNLYNLVATGALDPREVNHELLAAAERCGLLAEEPRQTHRTLASGRQVGLAHPGRPRQPPSPERTHPSPPRLLGRPASEPRRGGDGHGRRRPAGRLTVVRRVGACRRQAEPAPTPTTRRKEFLYGQPANRKPGLNPTARLRPPGPPRRRGVARAPADPSHLRRA
jgi:Bifunctional DNA primase/polymerase, N-terminal